MQGDALSTNLSLTSWFVILEKLKTALQEKLFWLGLLESPSQIILLE